MNTIAERIIAVVEAEGISKSEFARRIKVTPAYISKIGKDPESAPSERTILDICQKFNVNETWLRTGEGDMFLRRTRNEELSAFFGDVLDGEPDFRQRLFLVMSRMTTSEWELLEQMANRLAEETKKAGPN